MVERLKSRRLDGRRSNGGYRPGAGRKLGTVIESKRVARAQARLTGSTLMPDEMLRAWADMGYMDYARPGGKTVRIELTPSDRISCAKGAAPYYKAPLQAPKVAGDFAPSIVLQVDAAMIQQLAAGQQEVLRDMLHSIASGGVEAEKLAADPNRFAKILHPDSATEGRA